MVGIRASLNRQVKALVAIFAALVIALTTFTVATPSANAAYRWHCVVAKTHVPRHGRNSALCKHGYRFHWGVVYVIRKHHKRLVLKRFRTGHRGNALMGFPIKPRVPLGRVRVWFRNFGGRSGPDKVTSAIIYVHRLHSRR